MSVQLNFLNFLVLKKLEVFVSSWSTDTENFSKLKKFLLLSVPQ